MRSKVLWVFCWCIIAILQNNASPPICQSVKYCVRNLCRASARLQISSLSFALCQIVLPALFYWIAISWKWQHICKIFLWIRFWLSAKRIQTISLCLKRKNQALPVWGLFVYLAVAVPVSASYTSNWYGGEMIAHSQNGLPFNSVTCTDMLDYTPESPEDECAFYN